MNAAHCIGLMPCDVVPGKNGAIMVTTAPSFDAQLTWWIEEGVQEDLIDPKYMEPENLRLRTHRSMDIMRRWVANKDVEDLFHEAQSRHSPYGWVLPIEQVAQNPSLLRASGINPIASRAAKSPRRALAFQRDTLAVKALPTKA